MVLELLERGQQLKQDTCSELRMYLLVLATLAKETDTDTDTDTETRAGAGAGAETIVDTEDVLFASENSPTRHRASPYFSSVNLSLPDAREQSPLELHVRERADVYGANVCLFLHAKAANAACNLHSPYAMLTFLLISFIHTLIVIVCTDVHSVPPRGCGAFKPPQIAVAPLTALALSARVILIIVVVVVAAALISRRSVHTYIQTD